MSYRQRGTPFNISSLAEHLDLALAASEDLMRATAANAEFHTTLRLELTALTHVLQARQLAGDAIGEGALPKRTLRAFVVGTDALEVAASPTQLDEKPVKTTGLIGGCILITDLKASLATALGELGQHYSLDPEADQEDEFPAAPSFSEGEITLWARGSERE
jgi:hypothetical protein